MDVIVTGGPAGPRAPLGPVEPTGPCRGTMLNLLYYKYIQPIL